MSKININQLKDDLQPHIHQQLISTVTKVFNDEYIEHLNIHEYIKDLVIDEAIKEGKLKNKKEYDQLSVHDSLFGKIGDRVQEVKKEVGYTDFYLSTIHLRNTLVQLKAIKESNLTHAQEILSLSFDALEKLVFNATIKEADLKLVDDFESDPIEVFKSIEESLQHVKRALITAKAINNALAIFGKAFEVEITKEKEIEFDDIKKKYKKIFDQKDDFFEHVAKDDFLYLHNFFEHFDLDFDERFDVDLKALNDFKNASYHNLEIQEVLLSTIEDFKRSYSTQKESLAHSSFKEINELVGKANTLTLTDMTYFDFGNTKLQNTITKNGLEILEDQPLSVDITKEQNREYLVSMAFTEDIKLPPDYKYNFQDDLLVNALGNLFKRTSNLNKKNIVSIEQVINYMDGKPFSTKVADKRQKEVIDRIKTLMHLPIVINAQGHYEYNQKDKRKKQLNKIVFTGNMIEVRLWEVNDKQYIQLLEQPPLYSYAIETGQIIRFDADFLDLTRIVMKDDDGKVIEDKKSQIKKATKQRKYILYHIMQRMKESQNRKAFSIRFDTFFKAIENHVGVTIATSKQEHDVRENIRLVLDKLKEQKVLSYSFEYQGRKPSSIKIKIN